MLRDNHDTSAVGHKNFSIEQERNKKEEALRLFLFFACLIINVAFGDLR